jgi:hypothetical protein
MLFGPLRILQRHFRHQICLDWFLESSVRPCGSCFKFFWSIPTYFGIREADGEIQI